MTDLDAIVRYTWKKNGRPKEVKLSPAMWLGMLPGVPLDADVMVYCIPVTCDPLTDEPGIEMIYEIH